MLALAEQLPDYVVFYNGPACGASAPDHYHLQAVLKMTELLQGDHELRSCMMIESESRSEAEELFEDVYSYLRQRQPDREEPMINLIAFISGDRYQSGSAGHGRSDDHGAGRGFQQTGTA